MEVFKQYEGLDFLQKMELNRTIFWVGCGVSINYPTSLPSGKALTEFYVNHALGEDCGKIFFEKWNALSDCILRISKDKTLHKYEINAPLPRLEFIINCIDDVDIELQYAGIHNNRMLYGLSSMDHAPPNKNHYLISLLAENGATIITANFDTAIEKCFQNYPKLKIIYDIPVYETCKSRIFHYHGIMIPEIKTDKTAKIS